MLPRKLFFAGLRQWTDGFLLPRLSWIGHGTQQFSFAIPTSQFRRLPCYQVHFLRVSEFKFNRRHFGADPEETKFGIGDVNEGAGFSASENSEASGRTHDSKMTAGKTVSGLEIINEIMDKLQSNGKTFILPINDHAAMEAITEPFKIFLSIGIMPEFIVDACVCVPSLFTSLTQKGETSTQIIDLIVDFCSLTYEDSIRIFATYNEELLAIGVEEIQKCMEVLHSYGFEDEALGKIICSCPALLFAYKADRLAQNAENLLSYFTRNQMRSLLKSSPDLLLANSDETADKIEYIYCHMLLEGDDFTGCTKFSDISLIELIDRHEFLLKTGIYKTPDPKRPQFKMENPKLKSIINSNADEFATKIGGVSKQEWHLFRELREKQREFDSDGKTRPFERIKPSMRKQLERRKKTAQQSGLETFEYINEKY